MNKHNCMMCCWLLFHTCLVEKICKILDYLIFSLIYNIFITYVSRDFISAYELSFISVTLNCCVVYTILKFLEI